MNFGYGSQSRPMLLAGHDAAHDVELFLCQQHAAVVRVHEAAGVGSVEWAVAPVAAPFNERDFLARARHFKSNRGPARTRPHHRHVHFAYDCCH